MNYLIALVAVVLWLSPALAEDEVIEVRAYHAYVNKSGIADWLVPDYVVQFRVPKGRSWAIYPKTARAQTAFHYRGPSVAARDVGESTEITVVAGGRARKAAGYGRRDAWEYANELRVRYR